MCFWQATVPRLLEVSCSFVLHSSNAGELPRPVHLVITAPLYHRSWQSSFMQLKPIFLEFQLIHFSPIRQEGRWRTAIIPMLVFGYFVKRNLMHTFQRFVWGRCEEDETQRVSQLATPGSLRCHYWGPWSCCTLQVFLQWPIDVVMSIGTVVLGFYTWTVLCCDAFWIRSSCRFTWETSAYI